MDPNITKALNDKLYDKRKSGALELEGLIRDALNAQDHDRIAKIVHELCHHYAYAVHQPHARNGGLIGLAAASIALGPEVARYLEEIVPPVLACFSDSDARVRYYACESMYNIAKVAKGEILVYFNQVFDALCKLAADSELSVKNGAELLDRLVKDIVSESAASYVSVLHLLNESPGHPDDSPDHPAHHLETAFSLERFLPLLEERINVINPFTRSFLVAWVTLLDSIPDLELIAHLPRFLGGLFKFLSDSNTDVYTMTHVALERFLNEIRKIARIKKGIAESKRSHSKDGRRQSTSSSTRSDIGDESEATGSIPLDHQASVEEGDHTTIGSESMSGDSGKSVNGDGDWIPGQDVHVDHPKILEILVGFLSSPSDAEEEQTSIVLTALRWIHAFFEICPEDITPFVPSLLSHVLPRMSHDVDEVRQEAIKVNAALMDYIMSLSEDRPPNSNVGDKILLPPSLSELGKELTGTQRRDSNLSSRLLKAVIREQVPENKVGTQSPTPAEDRDPSPRQVPELDYQAAVSALTLQFLNEHEATRVAAIAWLIMLHRMAPGRILTVDDGTFPALLKTLSDPSDAVVTRDLLLLSQISMHSDDTYFTSFMVNLLKLFCTDRRLLETRGNLIIRQLCLTLSAEKIYRTMADCIAKDEDVEFASIMVQNLNNNLITAPELADLRRRLRNLENRDGQSFFVTLFKAWCHNAVATFSLCLLAQAYEQAYHLLQIFADLEMTVNTLIQIDKLVQLLESPVFTYLRIQLLEPERYPHLYKCLYGLLMLLPQSSAFAALKNRLNSVSAIGYLHIAPRTYVPQSNTLNHLRQKSSEVGTSSAPQGPSASGFERPNRLKAREEGSVKWNELLDRFKATQEKARRTASHATMGEDMPTGLDTVQEKESRIPPAVPPKHAGLRPNSPAGATRPPVTQAAANAAQGHKPRSSLSNLGRFAGGVAGRNKKK
ncbi:vacuolar protein 14 C-terminal Fig4p binding-domain-containing protein [Boeremia exigua]|uniref:vacuolar protein 14 C-terminal Fig4p binding-domain-containing protein n=1 Tax=Boeremia exigua TaxID=749465 RepID=UPI001E8CB49D|nr:vacuolar protein 14 C-terminal Fig4p binding-domain-containing protein [Boeremia exigua]KAH6643895.1 vacuolar protein 14 C-terminal Fig4p binding-domain-containing protein [Boeremia exigua]